jgi:hypothetical protein
MSFLMTAFLVLGALQAPRAVTGVIEGTITRANSTRPVEGARVAVWGDHGPDFKTTTDANGNYTVGDLPAGVYNMEVQAPGYLAVPNPWANQKVRLTVGDQKRVRYDVALAATAVVRGRILDDDRNPVAGVSVEILELDRDPDGRATWKGVSSALTGETGEFLAEDLPEGDYYIRASKRPSPASTGSADLGATYFPGTSDARSAAVVSLRDGGESNPVFSLTNARTYSIGGQVTQPDSRQLGALKISVIPEDSNIPSEGRMRSGMTLDAPKDGSRDFQIRGLLPGVYRLIVVSQAYTRYEVSFDNSGEVLWNSLTDVVAARVGTTAVEVRDEDVKDVRLALEPGVEVRGRIRVAGNLGIPPTLMKKTGAFGWFVGTSDPQQREFSSIMLTGEHDFVSDFVNLRPDVQGADATFAFQDVPPGTYRADLGSMRGVYLADVKDGGRSVFDEGLKVSNGPIDILELVVGFDGGTVQGTVNSTKDSPVLVVLAPQASRRQNGALFKTALLDDPSTPFQFVDVAPGIYSLFAFDASTAGTIPYRGLNFLEQHQQQSVRVTVESNAIVGPLRLRVISK